VQKMTVFGGILSKTGKDGLGVSGNAGFYPIT
jgi:hypothetical protein